MRYSFTTSTRSSFRPHWELANVSPSLGGLDASWLIRWTQVTPGQTGNGHIYYVGMDNHAAGSGSPTFFAGDTVGIPPANAAEHTKYFAYPQTRCSTPPPGVL